MKSNDLKAYALDFASYIIQNAKHHIDQIILFGSIARGDFTDKSDIDIFINTKGAGAEKEADRVLADFYKSVKFTKYWKLLGIQNDISLKVGNLDEWELKDSIFSHGIVLYGPYMSDVRSKPYKLFELKITGKRSDKIKVWRTLYGYTQVVKKKRYESKGLLQECNGKKLSKATFAVPADYAIEIMKFLKESKVGYRIYNIWSDSL